MTKKEFGTVIGKRRLSVGTRAGQTVIVSLGKPRRMKDHDDWECPFRIQRSQTVTTEYGYGVDAIQALTSALDGISVILAKGYTSVSWTGVLPDHSGFPRLLPISFGAAFSKRLNKIVDREIAREAKRLEYRNRRKLR